MEFSWCRIASQQNFSFPDVFQELWRLQGIKPYLPDKKEVDKEFQHIVKEYPKNSIRSYYLYKELPYDIEKKHLIEYREKIRQAPIGIRWTKEELDKFNSLSDVKEKRAMILKKSELKSVYIPHLKYEKEMIQYPNMPHDAESKALFKDGLEYFNNKEYDKAFVLLQKAAFKGNYVATYLICKISLKRLEKSPYRNLYFDYIDTYAVDLRPHNMSKLLEKTTYGDYKKAYKDMQDTLRQIELAGIELEKKGLPMGPYLQAEVYYHYLKHFSRHRFDSRYRKEYVKHIVRAANMGSYDAYMRLAHDGADLEWVLCAMISSLDYKCFDEFIRNFNTDVREYTSPRNLAIVRLAAMWGSNYAMDCLTFGETGNFLSVYKNQILNGRPKGAIYMPDNEELYRRKIYNQFYGEETGVFDGTLIPELDTIFPPKPVIHSPHGETMYIHIMLKRNPHIKHPLDKTATEADILAFRELLHKIDTQENGLFLGGGWGEYILKENKEYIDTSGPTDERRNMIMDFPNGSDEFIGYLNTLKLRELKQ
ncbi:hypothetical protein, partial [uncultured Brachyspira sp.]|uniref:hypothetical protein n=2 Tax=uncultured Brachyspira sp. TaxID=221953 RepID=UPI0026274878